MCATMIFNKYKCFMVCMLAMLFWGGPDVFNAQAAFDWTVHVERTVGNKQTDRGFFAQPTSDGGYIIVGETQNGQDYDLYLVKLSAKGYFQWHKTFGGINNDRGYSVRQTNDGGYIIAGTTQPVFARGDYNVYLVKTDTSGRQQWQREFGGTGEDTGTCVLQTTDGGYIIAGTTTSTGAGASDVYLIKTDSAGKKEWEKTFGGADLDTGKSVQQTKDGGFLVAGWSNSFDKDGYRLYLVEIDANGKKIRDKTWASEKFNPDFAIVPHGNKGYIVAG